MGTEMTWLHGWPLPYLYRSGYKVTDSEPISSSQFPFDDASVIEIDVWSLVCDSLILVLILTAVAFLNFSQRRCSTVANFSLAAITCGYFAIPAILPPVKSLADYPPYCGRTEAVLFGLTAIGVACFFYCYWPRRTLPTNKFSLGDLFLICAVLAVGIQFVIFATYLGRDASATYLLPPMIGVVFFCLTFSSLSSFAASVLLGRHRTYTVFSTLHIVLFFATLTVLLYLANFYSVRPGNRFFAALPIISLVFGVVITLLPTPIRLPIQLSTSLLALVAIALLYWFKMLGPDSFYCDGAFFLAASILAVSETALNRFMSVNPNLYAVS